MLAINNQIKEITGLRFNAIPSEIIHSDQPLVLKALVKEWPLVQSGLSSDTDACQYIRQYYTDRTVVLYKSTPEKKVRVFYTEYCYILDFESNYVPLNVVLDQLIECKNEPTPPTFYVGSTTVDVCLPGFRDANDLNLPDQNPLVSIWIGNRSRIAAHFDAPQNIACCAVGRRRFTVFPTDQAENLYMGPLDFTPSGQVISMVDFDQPDYEKFPKFRDALEHAQVTELEPGDALVLPSMWWHHVESLSDINVLINYWYRNVPRYMEPPTNVLHHAMLSIRDLPEHEKKAWKVLFDYYVFDNQNKKYEHIPEKARGFLNPIDETRARQLRSWLINKLNR